MEIDLRIGKVEVAKGTYDTLVLSHEGEEIAFADRVFLAFRGFHSTILGESRILLMKSSFPWASCSGVVVLRSSFFRSADEGREYTSRVLHGRYYDRAGSYELENGEAVGRIHYTFSRQMHSGRGVQRDDDASGFVRRVFGFFLSNEKTGAILNIKRLMGYINSGSHSCRLNILFGGLLVEKTMAAANSRLTKDIGLALEASNDRSILPRVLREEPGDAEARVFRLKLAEDRLSYDREGDGVHVSGMLSSNGYLVCSLQMLRKIKKLFYFAMGSYANSWPRMFLTAQAQVDESIPASRRAVLEMVGIDDRDLVSIRLEPPEVVQHIVFHDREADRVVVSFKGTTNSEETMQDINCEYTEFGDGFVHKGFRELAAQFIDSHAAEVEGVLRRLGMKRLLLVGHSLGGAIAILVKMMVGEMGLLKGVEVEATVFSSPPVVSEGIAARFSSGITVINYGNDMIPRTSYGSVLDLKFLCCSIGERHGPLDFGGDVEREVDLVLSHLQSTDMHPKLYFPGELVHMKRVRCSLNNNANPIVVVKSVDRRFFAQIVLIKHAPKHHMVGHIASVVDEGIRQLERGAGRR